MQKCKNDSLRKRYLYRVVNNSFGLIFGIVTQSMIARSLGPQAYGDFALLSNFFSRLMGILGLNTSTCFYTKFSRRLKEYSLVSFYYLFCVLVSLVAILFAVILVMSNTYKVILPDQKVLYVYMALIFGLLTWLVRTILVQTADAYGETARCEIISLFTKVIGVMVILFLFWKQQLNLTTLFAYHYLVLIMLGLGLVYILQTRAHLFSSLSRVPKTEIKKYVKEFYVYTSPVFTFTFFAFLAVVFDRWLLQYFSGSVEQGYYGLAFKIAGLTMLFTGALTSLLLREYSLAFHDKNMNKLRAQFKRYVPLFYSLAAFFACYLSVQADKVISIIGGEEYRQAFTAVAIMALFPIYQTYGQLGNTLFLATDRTKEHRNIGLLFTIIGIPMAFFLLAPKSLYGLGWGAIGLSIKMILLSAISINVRLYRNTKYLGLSYLYYLGHQICVVLCLLSLAFGASQIIEYLSMFSGHVITNFILAGFLYSIFVLIFIIILPVLFGLQRNDIQRVLKLVLRNK
jgi:O-antigen/teichoic acid export membrane protein